MNCQYEGLPVNFRVNTAFPQELTRLLRWHAFKLSENNALNSGSTHQPRLTAYLCYCCADTWPLGLAREGMATDDMTNPTKRFVTHTCVFSFCLLIGRRSTLLAVIKSCQNIKLGSTEKLFGVARIVMMRSSGTEFVASLSFFAWFLVFLSDISPVIFYCFSYTLKHTYTHYTLFVLHSLVTDMFWIYFGMLSTLYITICLSWIYIRKKKYKQWKH